MYEIFEGQIELLCIERIRKLNSLLQHLVIKLLYCYRLIRNKTYMYIVINTLVYMQCCRIIAGDAKTAGQTMIMVKIYS